MSPAVLLGGGGHARVVLDVLMKQEVNVLGFVDRNPDVAPFEGCVYLGSDDLIEQWSPQDIVLAHGIGSIGFPSVRHTLYERFSRQGFTFCNVIHPASIIASSVILAEGVQVMAGAVLQPGAIVGEQTIINTRSSVDHDCKIGAHAHIAPGVTLSGGVVVGDKTHIGSGATVIQGIKVGNHCMIAAGSVVVRDVPDHTRVMGVPAHPYLPG